MRETRVLVLAEDHEKVRPCFDCLGDMAEVRFQYDGAQGLADIGVWRPHVVFTELDLEALNGLEVAGRLRQDDSTVHIPVALLVHGTHYDGIEAAASAGIDSVISCPIEPTELLARTHLLAEMGRRRDTMRRRLQGAGDRQQHLHAALLQAGRFAMLGRLVGTLASQLSAYFTDIEGFCDVARSLEGTQVRRTLDQQARVVRRAHDLVDKLIEYARFQHPRLSLFEPGDAIETVRGMLQKRLETRGLGLEVDLPSDLVLWGDEALFCQMVLYLLGRACHVAPPESSLVFTGGYDDELTVLDLHCSEPIERDPAASAAEPPTGDPEQLLVPLLVRQMNGRLELEGSDPARVARLQLPYKRTSGNVPLAGED